MYIPYFSVQPDPPRASLPTAEETAAFLVGTAAALPETLDDIERRSRLVAALVRRWPQMTASEAFFLVKEMPGRP